MFSQSLCMGNDTLMALELNSFPTEPKTSEALDIIDESPTNTTSITSRSLRFRRQKQNSSNKTNNKISKDIASTTNVDNYSEFFQNDLLLDFNMEPNLPESNDFIDESPKNNTKSITSRSTRLRSQNQRKIDKHKPQPAEASTASENYSEFFKNNSEFSDRPIKSTAEPAVFVLDNSLDKYFKTDFESSTNMINENPSQNLDAMFQESEFHLQINEPQLLDIAITHTEDFADMSFDFSSFTIPNPAVTKAASQAIEWDDSSEFNNIEIPPYANDLVSRPQTELMVNDDFALGIDNVTFTQEFLPQRTVEKNSMLDSQKTVAQFMSEEMDKCIDIVKSGLGADEVVSTSFIGSQQQLNQSSLSNIVLNWSLDNVPKTNLVESLNYATPQIVQTTPRTLPQANLSSIESWGLSKEIVLGYVKKGIQTMFPWQVECLRNTKVGLLS